MTTKDRKALEPTRYASLLQFLNRHMQLLDEGRIEEWAAGFTQDGVFATEAVPDPVRGRADIVAGANHAKGQLSKDGIVRRHWLGMTEAHVDADGIISARSYALTLQTTSQAQAVIRFFNICTDTLTQKDDGGWLIVSRSITRS